MAIKDKSDDEWWRTLLQSRNDYLRQTVLHNTYTPMSLLTTLTEPQERSPAINNSQLAADVKTAWLKEEPLLLLLVEQPGLSLLRDLVRTGVTRKICGEVRHRFGEKQRYNALGVSYSIKRIILLR